MATKRLVPEPVVPTDADCLDLSALLAPLSRDDVELMLVRLLDKHPQEANWIVQVRTQTREEQATTHGADRHRRLAVRPARAEGVCTLAHRSLRVAQCCLARSAAHSFPAETGPHCQSWCSRAGVHACVSHIFFFI
jgi:hypothetical protein